MAFVLLFIYALLQVLSSLDNNGANGQNNTTNNFNFTIIVNNFNNLSNAMENAQTGLNLTNVGLQNCLGQALSAVPLIPSFSPNMNRIAEMARAPAMRGLNRQLLLQITARAAQTLTKTQRVLQNSSDLIQYHAVNNSNQLLARLDLNGLVFSCVNGLLGLVAGLLALVVALVAAVLALVVGLLGGLTGNPLLGQLLRPLQTAIQSLSAALMPGLESSMDALECEASAVSNCLQNLLAPLQLGGNATVPQQPVTITQCLGNLTALGNTLTALRGTLDNAAPMIQSTGGLVRSLAKQLL